MKKLQLKALELGATEILTREQLKSIFGGDDGSETPSGSGSGDNNCSSEPCAGDVRISA